MVIDKKQKTQNENEKQLQTNPTEMHHIVHVDTWHIAGTQFIELMMKYLVQVQKQTIRKMISINMKQKIFSAILLFKCRNMLFRFFYNSRMHPYYNVKKKERVYLFGNLLLIVCNPYVEH